MDFGDIKISSEIELLKYLAMRVSFAQNHFEQNDSEKLLEELKNIEEVIGVRLEEKGRV